MLCFDLLVVVLPLVSRLVAIDSRDRREGRPIEYLGWYGEYAHITACQVAACSS